MFFNLAYFEIISQFAPKRGLNIYLKSSIFSERLIGVEIIERDCAAFFTVETMTISDFTVVSQSLR